MAFTPEQARAELARRELSRRGINLNGEAMKSPEPSMLDSAVQGIAPLTNFLGEAGKVMEQTKQAGGYGFTVPGMVNNGVNLVQRGASKLGDYATEQLGQRGVNPYLSALAGMGVAYAPDAAMAATMPAIPEVGDLASSISKKLMRSGAKATVAPIVRATAGIPIQATNNAIEDTGILTRLPGTEQSVASQMGRVIDLVNTAKQRIGGTFGKIYQRYAQLDGPMQEIIDTPIAQKISPVTENVEVGQRLVPVETPPDVMGAGGKTTMTPGGMITEKQVTGFKPGQVVTVPRGSSSYSDLLINNKFAKQAFEKSDPEALNFLYKKYVSPNTDLSQVAVTDADKLKILTRLKREIQQQAQYNKEPITLRPIDSAKDAAFKTMSKGVDDLRSQIPNGNKLALVDDAWKEINDIYGSIQKDLADPGKARDTFMRLLKGDSTWLTSGKFSNKLKAIQKVETLTGQNILKPALNELTSMIFNEPFGRGLIAQTYTLMAAGAAVRSAVTGHIPEAIAELAAVPLASPKAIGLGLRGAAKVGGEIASGASLAGRNIGRLGLAGSRALKTRQEDQ